MSDTENTAIVPAAEPVGTADPVVSAKPEKAVKTKPVVLLRGYFPENGDAKQAAGTQINLPAEEARKVVKLGIAERADEF